eukprot:scaffold206373_cov28-Tisochrysis_lutea.AAC.2
MHLPLQDGSIPYKPSHRSCPLPNPYPTPAPEPIASLGIRHRFEPLTTPHLRTPALQCRPPSIP